MWPSFMWSHVHVCSHMYMHLCTYKHTVMATGKQMTAGDGKDDRKLIVTVPAGERDGQEYCQESREVLDRTLLGSMWP